MKELIVKLENNELVYFNKNNTKMIVWENEHYIFYSPYYKRWQSKKLDKQTTKLTIK